MLMRRMVWGAVCTVAAAMPATRVASAQIPLAATVALGGGGTFRGTLPSGSFYTGLGYNLLAGVTLVAPVLPVAVRFEAQYNQFSRPLSLFQDHFYSASVNGVYTLGLPIVHPYLIGGGGYYHMTAWALNPATTVGNPTEIDETLNGWGLNGGAGVRTGFTGFGLFAEWRYHYVFAGAQTPGGRVSFAPFTFGVTL